MNKLGAAVVGLIMIASLLLLPTFFSGMTGGNGLQVGGDFSFSSPDGSSTILGSQSAVNDSLSTVGTAAQDVGNLTVGVGKSIGHGFAAAAHVLAIAAHAIAGGIYNGTLAVVRGITSVLLFAVNTPANLVKHMASMSVASALIAPANAQEADTLDPNVYAYSAPAAAKVVTTAKTAPVATAAVDNRIRWPIHGAITTLFGVPEPPYQPIHTGIDISDGEPSGVTAVHPYKRGKVVQVIFSSRALGNHVVIDHGGGITSVYGHLYSISVKVGQQVTVDTKLGTEGTTGVSTGPHVHFEIRLNDTPVNPMDYIPGRP